MQGVRGKYYIKSAKRVGIGIGVGTFTQSSSKFYISILALAGFKKLLVRDNKSLEYARKYLSYDKVKVSTDLAFGLYHFFSSLRKDKNSKFKIGVVLRDWVYDDHKYIDDYLTYFDNQLWAYDISYYAFDKMGDVNYINRVRNKIKIYEPQNLEDFLVDFNQNSMIITSRAHGAILGSCLGIPGVCIGIEPKLSTIHEMLSESYSLVGTKPNQDLMAIVKNYESNYKKFSQLAVKEAREHSRILKRDLEELREEIFENKANEIV